MNDFFVLVAVPVIRSVGGWVENAFADGKVTWPEWKKLFSTILRIGVPALFLYYGLELPVESAAVLPALVDYGFNWLKKAKK